MRKLKILVSFIVSMVFVVMMVLPVYASESESRSLDVPYTKLHGIKHVSEVAGLFRANLDYRTEYVDWDTYYNITSAVSAFELGYFVGLYYTKAIPFYADGTRIPESKWNTTRSEGGQYILLAYCYTGKDSLDYVSTATLFQLEWSGSMDPDRVPTAPPTPSPKPTPFPTPGPQGTPLPTTLPTAKPTSQSSASVAPRPTGTFDKYTVLEGPDVVYEGDLIHITFNSPESGAMEGSIEISGLNYLGIVSSTLGSSLSSKDHVFVYNEGPTIYEYQVSASAGEQVFMQLVDAQCGDKEGDLFSIPVQAWSRTVQAKAMPSPTASPIASPTPAPTPSVTVKPTATPPLSYPTAELVPNSHLTLGTDDLGIPCLRGLTLKDAPNTYRELLQHFRCPSNCDIYVIDPENNAVQDLSARPATGYWVIQQAKDPSKGKDFAIIIVEGDVLGTGRASIAQLVRLANAVAGKEPLVWPYKYAVNNGNPPTIADLVKMAQSLK